MTCGIKIGSSIKYRFYIKKEKREMLITLKKEKKKNSKVNNSIFKDNLLFYSGQIVSKKLVWSHTQISVVQCGS